MKHRRPPTPGWRLCEIPHQDLMQAARRAANAERDLLAILGYRVDRAVAYANQLSAALMLVRDARAGNRPALHRIVEELLIVTLHGGAPTDTRRLAAAILAAAVTHDSYARERLGEMAH